MELKSGEKGNYELISINKNLSESTENIVSSAPHYDSVSVSSSSTVLVYSKCGYSTCCVDLSYCCCYKSDESMDGGGSRKTYTFCSGGWWKHQVFNVDKIKPSALVSSYFFPPYVILIVRSIVALYVAIALIVGAAYDWQGGYFFFYFTNLSYTGLVVYYLITSGLSIHHFLYANSSAGKLKRHATNLEILASWLYCALFSTHVIVMVVYWTLLSDGWSWAQSTVEERWLNISRHGLDFATIFIDYFLNRTVYSWGFLTPTLLVVLLYVFWGWIANSIFGYFPYFFLDYSKGSSYGYILGILILFLIDWSLSFSLHWLRAIVGKRK